MKLLTKRDSNVEDNLALYFEGTFAPQVELERVLEPFLQAMEEYAGEWMPDIVEGKRRRNRDWLRAEGDDRHADAEAAAGSRGQR